MAIETITLGGGCFWCTEAVYEKVRGVTAVESGYSNGHVPMPTYEQVCEGTTGHAEVVKVSFDTEQITLREVLEIFFVVHDPTTLNRQGNDIGTSYRSAIFYTDDEQHRVAEETIADVEASGRWPGKVVTEVTPAGAFWEAEPEHQDYLERYPNGYTCHFVRPDWVLPQKTPAAG
jgi:peptide-methionine (S)-S-oxide reductase